MGNIVSSIASRVQGFVHSITGYFFATSVEEGAEFKKGDNDFF